MPSSLKSKTTIALFWSFTERISQMGIQFVISIILARLLLPEDYGVIGMIIIFMAIAQSFIDSGFGSALIQKKDVNHTDKCSVFYFNIFIAFIVAGLLCLAAPSIASFFNQPILTPITRIMSLNLIISSLGLIQSTMLIKKVDFKTQFQISMVGTSISGCAGILMAYKGFGVWSLVAHSLILHSVRTVLLWVFSKWRPTMIFSFKSLKTMFGYGSKLLLSGLINTIFNNIYFLIIGKMFSAADLGYYTRAVKLKDLPVNSLSLVVRRVTFPVFSSIHDDQQRLKNGVRKALKALVFLNFPLMIGMAVVAEPLVYVLLTDKWASCIPYVKLLCVVGLMFPLHIINLNVLKAQGRSDLFLKLEIIRKLILVIVIAISYRWGIIAIIYGQILQSIIAYCINCYYTGKILKYPLYEQLKDISPYLIISILMGTCVHCIQLLSFDSSLFLLIIQTVTGMTFYFVICGLFRLEALMEVMAIIGNLGKKFQKA